MGLTSIELSKEQKMVIFRSGHTIKGVFNLGFRILFIDKSTPIDAKIKRLQEQIELQQRYLTRFRTRIQELEDEVKKNAMEQKNNRGKK